MPRRKKIWYIQQIHVRDHRTRDDILACRAMVLRDDPHADASFMTLATNAFKCYRKSLEQQQGE